MHVGLIGSIGEGAGDDPCAGGGGGGGALFWPPCVGWHLRPSKARPGGQKQALPVVSFAPGGGQHCPSDRYTLLAGQALVGGGPHVSSARRTYPTGQTTCGGPQPAVDHTCPCGQIGTPGGGVQPTAVLIVPIGQADFGQCPLTGSVPSGHRSVGHLPLIIGEPSGQCGGFGHSWAPGGPTGLLPSGHNGGGGGHWPLIIGLPSGQHWPFGAVTPGGQAGGGGGRQRPLTIGRPSGQPQRPYRPGTDPGGQHCCASKVKPFGQPGRQRPSCPAHKRLPAVDCWSQLRCGGVGASPAVITRPRCPR